MSKGGLVHYVCIADAHASRESKSSSDTLTVVTNRWAYCAFDARAEGPFAQLPAEDRSR